MIPDPRPMITVRCPKCSGTKVRLTSYPHGNDEEGPCDCLTGMVKRHFNDEEMIVILSSIDGEFLEAKTLNGKWATGESLTQAVENLHLPQGHRWTLVWQS